MLKTDEKQIGINSKPRRDLYRSHCGLYNSHRGLYKSHCDLQKSQCDRQVSTGTDLRLSDREAGFYFIHLTTR